MKNARSLERRRVTGVLFFRAVVRTIRYRFFLVAGVFPFLLGAAVDRESTGTVDGWVLLAGLAGIMFVGAGREGMNEYFDSKISGDRVFASGPPRPPALRGSR